MSTNNTYLAVFLGSKTGPRMTAWDALPEGERRAKEQEGIAASKAWSEKHHAAGSRIVLGILGGYLRIQFAGFGKLPNLEEPIDGIDF